MAKGLGNNYYLWLESSTPGTYNYIKGQRNLKRSNSSGKIDTSSKETFPYGTSAPGARDVALSLDIVPDLPDTNGYTRLETLCNAAVPSPFNIQIRKGGTAGAGGDVVFAASMYGNLSGHDFPQNGAVGVTLELSLAAAPTTDVLAV